MTPLERINVPVDWNDGEGGTKWAKWVNKLQLGGEGVKPREQVRGQLRSENENL